MPFALLLLRIYLRFPLLHFVSLTNFLYLYYLVVYFLYLCLLHYPRPAPSPSRPPSPTLFCIRSPLRDSRALAYGTVLTDKYQRHALRPLVTSNMTALFYLISPTFSLTISFTHLLPYLSTFQHLVAENGF